MSEYRLIDESLVRFTRTNLEPGQLVAIHPAGFYFYPEHKDSIYGMVLKTQVREPNYSPGSSYVLVNEKRYYFNNKDLLSIDNYNALVDHSHMRNIVQDALDKLCFLTNSPTTFTISLEFLKRSWTYDICINVEPTTKTSRKNYLSTNWHTHDLLRRDLEKTFSLCYRTDLYVKNSFCLRFLRNQPLKT